MQSLAEKHEGLVLILGATGATSTASCINAFLKYTANVSGRSIPVAILIGDVVFHPRPGVNLKLTVVDWTAQAGVITPSIFAFTIALTGTSVIRRVKFDIRVVNVLDGKIASESLLGNFKLSRDVSVREEAESHDDIQDGLQVDLAETGNINSLTVVTKPVAKVDLKLAWGRH